MQHNFWESKTESKGSKRDVVDYEADTGGADVGLLRMQPVSQREALKPGLRGERELLRCK